MIHQIRIDRRGVSICQGASDGIGLTRNDAQKRPRRPCWAPVSLLIVANRLDRESETGGKLLLAQAQTLADRANIVRPRHRNDPSGTRQFGRSELRRGIRIGCYLRVDLSIRGTGYSCPIHFG